MQKWIPPEFKNFNDRTFRDPNVNMQAILDMLEGKPNAKTWNNIHNTSMHVMMKWDEAELRDKICPSMSPAEFAQLIPKQIGCHLEAWFELLVINK